VPNDLHDALAEDALSMGKHVLVEYPLTTDAASAQRLAAKAAETGAVLMTGNTMFHESLWTYLQTHAQGLGEIVSAASRVAWHSPDLRGAWYLDPARSGSCFHAFHYHHIALYRRLLGEVSSVSAIDESRTGPHGRSLSGGTMSMRHQSGATSVIQWYLGTGSGGLSRSLDLTGTSGGLSILGMDGDDSTSTAVWHGGGATGRETFGNDWGVAGSTGEFLAAISGNFDHRAQLADDLRCLQIAGCAAESARQGGNWREMGLVL
jgi:predicted dehydrogenase